MNKILYIDLFSQYGHINLNKVYIKRIMELGFEIDFVLRKGYIKDLGIEDEQVTWTIPEEYYNPEAGKFGDRVAQFKMLRYIKKNIRLNEYRYVFFSFFEEISLYLSGIRGNFYYLNHSNVAGLDNWVKRYFLKKVAKRGTIIVFHELIKKRFAEFGIDNVQVEQLGLFQPYNLSDLSDRSVLRKIDIRIASDDFEYMIFLPTGSKYADYFISDIINDLLFLRFLEKNRVLMVIKDETLTSAYTNICILKSFLSLIEYKSLFSACDTILINYPASFQYKVSAVLFECFSNNKPCLLSDIESFRLFDEYFNYDPFFSNKNNLMEAIEKMLLNKDLIQQNPFNNLEQLNPKLVFFSL